MNRLKVIRAERGIRQWTLAQLSGLNQSIISMIENEVANPTDEQKAKIATALSLSVSEIWPPAQRERRA
jgi:DNA-binding XRE family transcriptional regulator